MKTDFLTQLREENDPLWRRIYSHPFIKEVADGSLPQEKLKVYIVQDHLYLIEFARCCALAAGRSRDLQTMTDFVMIASQTLERDVPNHRRLIRALGIEYRDLDEAKPLPTCLAYTKYMVRVASTGSSGEVAATLCPCLWTYAELGKVVFPAIKRRIIRPDAELWKYYSADVYKAIVESIKRMINEGAANADDGGLERMRKHFKTASEYEYMFWDMAYGR